MEFDDKERPSKISVGREPATTTAIIVIGDFLTQWSQGWGMNGTYFQMYKCTYIVALYRYR